MEFIYELGDIRQAAKKFWEHVEGKKVFAFHGQMGSGKTTFIHALCDIISVSSPVGSPTFSIINEYQYPGGSLFHIDLYRLKNEEEVIRAGVEDCLYSGDTCLVEWPEKAPSIFPPDTVHVYVEIPDAMRRKITIKSVS
jgi:tRNA threonylcarbamoyladenosine biosynthesis protein TsaE